mmetsp:Transcript_15766/g.33931  ORF Transcript_15766/g.33931 Transcript_15766/m.33931 type:complete len:80 (-) Transcript_15766:902-1141(-)
MPENKKCRRSRRVHAYNLNHGKKKRIKNLLYYPRHCIELYIPLTSLSSSSSPPPPKPIPPNRPPHPTYSPNDFPKPHSP